MYRYTKLMSVKDMQRIFPPRPREADSTWVITPNGWVPPPTMKEMVAMLPAPWWRKLWSRMMDIIRRRP